MLYKLMYSSISVSVLSPSKTCHYVSGKVLTLRTSRRHNCNDFQLLHPCLSLELYRNPCFRKAFCVIQFGWCMSTCRNPTPVLAQEACGCLGTWGRWQVRQAPVTVNTSPPGMLPESQGPYLKMKTFWRIQSGSASSPRQGKFCHFPMINLYYLILDKTPSLSPRGRTWFLTSHYLNLSPFVFRKNICEDFSMLQTSS